MKALKFNNTEVAGSTFRGRNLKFNIDISDSNFYLNVKDAFGVLIERIDYSFKDNENVSFELTNIEFLKQDQYTIEYWAEFDVLGTEMIALERFVVVNHPCEDLEDKTLNFILNTDDIDIEFEINVNVINIGGGSYELPIASSDALGGVKIGANLSINPETGVLSASSGGGGTSIIDITAVDFKALVLSSTLVPSAIYRVSRVDMSLYGGTKIFLQAVDEGEFIDLMQGIFYNPNYSLAPQFNPDATINVNDKRTYGGKVWENITGEVGSSIDDFTMDSNWSLKYQHIYPQYYNIAYDTIKYNFELNTIDYREDLRGNKVSATIEDIMVIEAAIGVDKNPIKHFKWGNVDVYNNDVHNGAFIDIINSVNCIIARNDFNESYIYNNVKLTMCVITANEFFNTEIYECSLKSFYFTNNQFKSLDFNNVHDGLSDFGTVMISKCTALNSIISHLSLYELGNIQNCTLVNTTLDMLSFTGGLGLNHKIFTNVHVPSHLPIESPLYSNSHANIETNINNEAIIRYINGSNVQVIEAL